MIKMKPTEKKKNKIKIIRRNTYINWLYCIFLYITAHFVFKLQSLGRSIRKNHHRGEREKKNQSSKSNITKIEKGRRNEIGQTDNTVTPKCNSFK